MLNDGRWATAAVLTLAAAMPLSGAVPQLVTHLFAQETILNVGGSGYAEFTLPETTDLILVEVASSSENNAILLSGPSEYWLVRSGDHWSGLGGPGGLSFNLKQGEYFAYVSAQPGTQTVITLEFRELTGSTHVDVSEPIEAGFHQLDPTLPTDGIQRFVGQQPFDGPSFSGFLIVERSIVPDEHVREYRWSVQDGIVACQGHATGALGIGQETTTIGAAWSGASRSPVTLTYFRQPVGAILDDEADGFWIGRAPSDQVALTAPVAPPGWALLQEYPIVDQDAWCAQQELGRLVSIADR